MICTVVGEADEGRLVDLDAELERWLEKAMEGTMEARAKGIISVVEGRVYLAACYCCHAPKVLLGLTVFLTL